LLKEKTVIKIAGGLQARSAAQFVQAANRYSAHIEVEKAGKAVNAKSIMGIMSLALRQGEEVVLSADGPDEAEAVAGLKALIEKTD
jgi:catabolite repression HPr-like protein